MNNCCLEFAEVTFVRVAEVAGNDLGLRDIGGEGLFGIVGVFVIH